MSQVRTRSWHSRGSLGLLALALLLAQGVMVSSVRPASGQQPTTPPEDIVKEARISKWQPVFRGIELCEASIEKPRPLQVRAARIDLREPGIRFFVTPSNGDAPGEVNGRRSTQFMTEFKVQLAINASFFGGKFDVGAEQDVVGLSMSNGDMYSEPDHRAALLISKDNRAWIAQPPKDVDKAYNAVAGDTIIVQEGRNIVDREARDGFTGGLHPRTAAGITRDGRYLILMTTDGRQAGYSEGTSKAETAEWLIKLGVWVGLNLDGGGSTNLVIEGPDGQPKLINHPPSTWLRACANHIGVYAKPLPKRPATTTAPS